MICRHCGLEVPHLQEPVKLTPRQVIRYLLEACSPGYGGEATRCSLPVSDLMDFYQEYEHLRNDVATYEGVLAMLESAAAPRVALEKHNLTQKPLTIFGLTVPKLSEAIDFAMAKGWKP